MNTDKKRTLRDLVRLSTSLLFFFLYIPHLIVYLISKKKRIILNDLDRMSSQMHISVHSSILLLYQLHTNRYFRTLFYYRVGTIGNLLLSWYRPGDRYFTISYTTQIGEGINLVHPYATILNAESIGKNFTCLHCTTIGKSNGKKPVIGDDVTLGAHVCIIGGVHIGSNVQIGAGSVVVKDIPSNCIAVGNPAKPIKFLDENVSIF